MNPNAKILAFDISKKSTGWAFYDGEFLQEGLGAIQFKNSVQWEQEVGETLETWNPDLVTFSETITRLRRLDSDRALLGQMFLLEHICFKKEISVSPTFDIKAKSHNGITAKKSEEELIEITEDKVYQEGNETIIEKVTKLKPKRKGWMSKQLKEKALKWANQQGVTVEIDDIADAMCFAKYLYDFINKG
jgi:hypothetical protein